VEQARELVRKSGKAMVIEGAREGAEVQMSEVSGQTSESAVSGQMAEREK
jgi:hypothetical protein